MTKLNVRVAMAGAAAALLLAAASDGSALILQADTLCVHGDNAGSIAAVQRIRHALQALPA